MEFGRFLCPCSLGLLFIIICHYGNISAARVKCTKLYVINRGDQFSRIAKEFGLTETRLFELNPLITDAHSILAGDRLCVGTSADRETITAMPVEKGRIDVKFPMQNSPKDRHAQVVTEASEY